MLDLEFFSRIEGIEVLQISYVYSNFECNFVASPIGSNLTWRGGGHYIECLDITCDQAFIIWGLCRWIWGIYIGLSLPKFLNSSYFTYSIIHLNFFLC